MNNTTLYPKITRYCWTMNAQNSNAGHIAITSEKIHLNGHIPLSIKEGTKRHLSENRWHSCRTITTSIILRLQWRLRITKISYLYVTDDSCLWTFWVKYVVLGGWLNNHYLIQPDLKGNFQCCQSGHLKSTFIKIITGTSVLLVKINK